jgi:hypothetical protein
VATTLVLNVTVRIPIDTAYWTIGKNILHWGSMVATFIIQYLFGDSYFESFTKGLGKAHFGIVSRYPSSSLLVCCCRDAFSLMIIRRCWTALVTSQNCPPIGRTVNADNRFDPATLSLTRKVLAN